MKVLFAIFLWCVTASGVFAANYYVSPNGSDRNAGTREAPWQSVAHAGKEAKAGDTVIFLPGDYAGRLDPANSGSPGAPIVFKAAQRRQARLIGDDAGAWNKSGHGGRIRLDGVSHIVLKGFDVVDTAVDRSTGGWLWAKESSHITIDDCSFTGGYRWSHFWIEDSKHVKILNNDFARLRHSGDMWRIHSVRHLLVEANSFSRSLHTQIGIMFGADVVVRGNVFHSGWSRNFSTNSNTRVLVENNIFTNGYNGSWSAGAMNQFTGNVHIIRYNQVFRNFGIPWIMTASSTRETQHNRIYNNVFYGNHGVGMLVSGNHANLSDLIVQNNIFAANDPHGSQSQFSTTGGEAESTLLIANDFYADKEDAVGLVLYGAEQPLSFKQIDEAGGGAASKSLSALRQILRNNFELEPDFESPKNFNFALLAKSPLVGRGLPLTATASAGSGRKIPVEDVYPFFDGFGIEGESGDLIAVGNASEQAVILEVDLEKKVLLIDRDLQWEAGAPVSFPWSGNGPSLGVYEYGSDVRASVQVVADKGVLSQEEAVNLTAVARGLKSPLTYDWQLGDGRVAKGEKVTHVYDETGDYGIRVRVTDATGKSMIGVGYVMVEAETDPNVFLHTTFDADDEDWWIHWQFYRGRRGTSYAKHEQVLDSETGNAYHRIATLDGTGPLPAFLHPKNWNIDEHPTVRIRYRIRPGTPIAIFVQPFPSGFYPRKDLDFRQDSRRYYFAGTHSEPRGEQTLIDDGKWHEITFDVRDIRSEYPDVQVLQALHIGDLEIDGGTEVGRRDEFALDEIYIGK